MPFIINCALHEIEKPVVYFLSTPSKLPLCRQTRWQCAWPFKCFYSYVATDVQTTQQCTKTVSFGLFSSSLTIVLFLLISSVQWLCDHCSDCWQFCFEKIIVLVLIVLNDISPKCFPIFNTRRPLLYFLYFYTLHVCNLVFLQYQDTINRK